MKHVHNHRKNKRTRRENTSRGRPRVLGKQKRLTKPVCPRSLMSRNHECHEVVKKVYLPLLTSPHSKDSFSEYVSNCALSLEDSKKEWAPFFHPLLRELHEPRYLSLVHRRLEIVELHPPHDKFKYWLIDTLLANSLSSCVRKVAEARSAGSTIAATIAARMVEIPSRIWQCQLTCAWRGNWNWRKSIANPKDHPHPPFGLLLKQEDLGQWHKRTNEGGARCLCTHHQRHRIMRLVVTSTTTFGINFSDKTAYRMHKICRPWEFQVTVDATSAVKYTCLNCNSWRLYKVLRYKIYRSRLVRMDRVVQCTEENRHNSRE